MRRRDKAPEENGWMFPGGQKTWGQKRFNRIRVGHIQAVKLDTIRHVPIKEWTAWYNGTLIGRAETYQEAAKMVEEYHDQETN